MNVHLPSRGRSTLSHGRLPPPTPKGVGWRQKHLQLSDKIAFAKQGQVKRGQLEGCPSIAFPRPLAELPLLCKRHWGAEPRRSWWKPSGESEGLQRACLKVLASGAKQLKAKHDQNGRGLRAVLISRERSRKAFLSFENEIIHRAARGLCSRMRWWHGGREAGQGGGKALGLY